MTITAHDLAREVLKRCRQDIPETVIHSLKIILRRFVETGEYKDEIGEMLGQQPTPPLAVQRFDEDDATRFRWWLSLWCRDSDEAMDALNDVVGINGTPDEIRAAIDAAIKNAAPQAGSHAHSSADRESAPAVAALEAIETPRTWALKMECDRNRAGRYCKALGLAGKLERELAVCRAVTTLCCEKNNGKKE